MRQRSFAAGSGHVLDEPITFNRITHDGGCRIRVRGWDGTFAQDGSFATIHIEAVGTGSRIGFAGARESAEVTVCYSDRVNWYGHGEQSGESGEVVPEHVALTG